MLTWTDCVELSELSAEEIAAIARHEHLPEMVALDLQEEGGGTLFDRVTPEMSIYRDEIFGPVLVLLRADTFEEALELVNRNPYGNGAALFA